MTSVGFEMMVADSRACFGFLVSEVFLTFVMTAQNYCFLVRQCTLISNHGQNFGGIHE